MMYQPHSFLLCVLLSGFLLVEPTAGQPPTWVTGSSFSKTSSECTEITTLQANSVTGATVVYSVQSETPNAGFAIAENLASNKILTCTAGSVSQSSYVVVVRAEYQTTAESSDNTITITFTDQTPATGPTWNTGTSHSVDKGVNTACNSVVTLSATSTDGSASVSYSIQGSSDFTISGSNILACTIASLTQSSYTVTVRANQDNNVPTDLTLTITVTDSSSSGNSGESSGSGGSNDARTYGVAFGAVGGAAAIIGVTVLVIKAPKRRRDKKDTVATKSSGGILSTNTNAVKPEAENVNHSSNPTTEKANNVLPNGAATV